MQEKVHIYFFGNKRLWTQVYTNVYILKTCQIRYRTSVQRFINQITDMSDQYKIRIRTLNDKSDYELWRILIFAALKSKNILEAFTPSDSDKPESDLVQKSSNLILSVPSDQALSVVRADICITQDMLTKLYAG